MINLDEQIRAAVQPDEVQELEPFIHGLQRALISVLDDHEHFAATGAIAPVPEPPEIEDSAGGLSVRSHHHGFGCTVCHYEGYGSVKGYGWCRTVRGIAQELGIDYDVE